MSEVDAPLVLLERHARVAVLRLNRPDTLNALNEPLMQSLGAHLNHLDQDPSISVIVITGNERAFAAGADIADMAERSYQDVYQSDFITRHWEHLRRVRKPVIAAVEGYALGGGCELAMMCDIIIAAEDARFGQPEIKLGIIPGAGGTQRLPRAIGKAKAMDMCLTGRHLDAAEAERAGLISRVAPKGQALTQALAAAQTIATYPMPALMALKESLQRTYESSLSEGLLFERRAFHSLFATEDQKEGMRAFLAKRAPHFRHE